MEGVQKTDMNGNKLFPFAIYENFVHYDILEFTNWHWHNAIQFCLMLEGSAEFIVNKDIIVLKKGQALFINSGQLHKTVNPKRKEGYYLCFSVEPEMFRAAYANIVYAKYVAPYIGNPENAYCLLDNDAIDRLREINECSHEKDRELKIYANLFLLWSNLYESFFRGQGNTTFIDNRMKSVIEYINSHYQEKITLEEISEHVNLAKTYCCREFKENMGCTIFEYLNNYRILKSVEMLRSDMSVTDISFACGFNSTSFFIKVFKEKMMVTPKEYRKELK